MDIDSPCLPSRTSESPDPSTNDLQMDMETHLIPENPVLPQCKNQPEEDPFRNRNGAPLASSDLNVKLPASFRPTKDKRDTHDHAGACTLLPYDSKAHISSTPNRNEGLNIDNDTLMKAPKNKQTYSLQGKQIHQPNRNEGPNIDNDTPMKAP